MKIRNVMLLLGVLVLLVAGCGSDSKSKSGDEKPATKAEKERAKDAKVKATNVKKAEKAFKKDSKDVGACRNLGMAWISKASPASVTDPKAKVVPPKDREKSLKQAISVLEDCRDLDENDRDVKIMLSSVYMSAGKQEKAIPILRSLAKSAKGAERPNAYYSWGLAANNAQDYNEAIEAWSSFVRIAPKSDTRVKQTKQSIKALKAAARAQQAADKAKEKAGDKKD